MCDVIHWKSSQKNDTVQHDIDNFGKIPYGHAMHCNKMVRSGLFLFQIDSSSYLGTGSSESVIFQSSKDYPNKVVV